MPPAALPQVALRCTPDSRRKRGRPKETWRRTVEKEMKENSWTRGHLERRAPDRSQWRPLTEALCVSKHEEDKASNSLAKLNLTLHGRVISIRASLCEPLNQTYLLNNDVLHQPSLEFSLIHNMALSYSPPKKHYFQHLQLDLSRVSLGNSFQNSRTCCI